MHSTRSQIANGTVFRGRICAERDGRDLARPLHMAGAMNDNYWDDEPTGRYESFPRPRVLLAEDDALLRARWRVVCAPMAST